MWYLALAWCLLPSAVLSLATLSCMHLVYGSVTMYSAWLSVLCLDSIRIQHCCTSLHLHLDQALHSPVGR